MLEKDLFGQRIGNNRTWVTQKSFDLAAKISQLADGLTHDELVTAMKMALEDTEHYFILKLQVGHVSEKQSLETLSGMENHPNSSF